MKHPRILVVDADQDAETAYRTALQPFTGANLVFLPSVGAAQQQLTEQGFELIVAAVDGQTDGMAVLEAAHVADPDVPVVLVAREPSVAGAALALRREAGDYLDRARLQSELAATIQRLLARRRQGAEYALLRRHVERAYGFEDFIGASPAMQQVFQTIEKVAASNIDVLVRGETGTGKELVARAIHRRSPRAERPFVPVDCGAIPDNLLESELFGHERGAFTGADSRRIGLLEFADGGTFFLDELAELPLLLQAKLLRTLQERKVRRVGGRDEIDIDVRVVAATSRDLEQMIKQGQFRQDLYYRINVVQIQLPPLRERGDDIGLLAEYFAYRHSREMGKRIVGIAPEAYQVLRAYAWPGNVRELQNVVRRGLALAQGPTIGLDDLPNEVVERAGRNDSSPARGYFQLRDEHVARFERQYLCELLARHHGDVRAAAAEAQLPRGTLYRLMKNHGLDSADFRD